MCAVGDCRKRTTHRKILNERTIAYYLCRVNFHAIAVCDTHYLNTCRPNFVILWKFLMCASNDIRHCLASIASLACLHVLFFVFLGLTCVLDMSPKMWFLGKDIGRFLLLLALNIELEQ